MNDTITAMSIEQITKLPIGTPTNFGIFQGIVHEYGSEWFRFGNILGGYSLLNLKHKDVSLVRTITQEEYDKIEKEYHARMVEYVDNLPHNATV